MTDPIVERFLRFLDASPTSYHCAQTAARWLIEAGFEPIDHTAPPSPLPPGAKRFIHHNGVVIAFRVGSAPTAQAGFHMVLAHTDSPNLRIKPQPYIVEKGYVRLGVEVYGGAILATWTDRDLGIAGQVVLRDGDGQRSVLVDLRKPLARVPNVAIHLNRRVNEDGLKLNKQKHMPVLFALEDEDDARPLHTLLASEVGCEADDILAWDLSLYDLTPATLSGANDEFLHSARLDNVGSCHAGLEALIGSVAFEPGPATAVLALFDHEEVGSRSVSGADGRMLEHVLERITRDATLQEPGGLSRALSVSMAISADMTHAVHPGWADKSEPQHLPHLNRGPAIKQNHNQRYGTSGETAAIFLRLCEKAGVPSQYFVSRSDMACGTTVGPIVSAGVGVSTVDVGNPMLSMHSAREMCGAKDQPWMVAAMREWFTGS